MRPSFTEQGWEHYIYWQETDKKMLKKINALIKECQRNPYEGTGQPEPLRHDLSGWWSRRITQEHRLVYRIEGEMVVVAQCRNHY
jgi:toxin YoeB